MNSSSSRMSRGVVLVAWALVGLWGLWWVASIRDDRLILGERTWMPVLPFLAGDFLVHVDHVTRCFVSGENPYLKSSDWVCLTFPYPPMLMRLFSWVALVRPMFAGWIWQGALAAIFTAGAAGAYRARKALRLSEAPFPVILAAVLYATPVLFAMERGQVDPIAIPAYLTAAWLLRRRTNVAELTAGGLLGVVAWVKYYPGLALLGLASYGRTRAVVAFVVVAGLIGVYDRANVARAIANGRSVAKENARYHPIHPVQHGVSEVWPSLTLVRGVRLLRKIRGPLAAGLLIGPVVAGVCLRLWQTRRRAGPALLFPTFLWFCAAATFAMPYSNDYNVVALPLAALCVWDRRDPVGVHMVMGLLMLWWQPIALSIGGDVLFVAKLAGLYAVGVSLVARAREASAAEPPSERHWHVHATRRAADRAALTHTP